MRITVDLDHIVEFFQEPKQESPAQVHKEIITLGEKDPAFARFLNFHVAMEEGEFISQDRATGRLDFLWAAIKSSEKGSPRKKGKKVS